MYKAFTITVCSLLSLLLFTMTPAHSQNVAKKKAHDFSNTAVLTCGVEGALGSVTLFSGTIQVGEASVSCIASAHGSGKTMETIDTNTSEADSFSYSLTSPTACPGTNEPIPTTISCGDATLEVK